jgi:predicted DNA-binding protein YlxM (UPF0122 family)
MTDSSENGNVNIIYHRTGEHVTSVERLNELVDEIAKERGHAVAVRAKELINANHALIPKGNRKGTHKLSKDQQEQLFESYAAGKYSLRELANDFGVSDKTIKKYLRVMIKELSLEQLNKHIKEAKYRGKPNTLFHTEYHNRNDNLHDPDKP